MVESHELISSIFDVYIAIISACKYYYFKTM